ncbi:MAG: glycosyltransferase [Acidobacteria bacterium]|nr:glycosyltransferase [Acidobacteriota bacterium]
MSVLYGAAYAVCLCITAGGVVFYVLALIAARRYRREARDAFRVPGGFTPSISVLKPLAGLEANLEENLRTFFEQDYPQYQILFAVREANDPAAGVARRLMQQHPQQDAELIVAGEPEFPNAKVWSLHRMAGRARYSVLVVSDSDIRASRDYLRGVAADYADPRVGVATCPYRAEPGGGIWSLVEALTLNTEFWCGVLVARALVGMKFAVGPTMILRREYLDAIGGFAAVGTYLAEDFVLGQWAERHGYKAARCSRPWGYVGQVFTNPLPFALVLMGGPAMPLAALVLLLRAAVAAAVGCGLLRDPLTRRYFWLAPVADVASLIVWALGFFGNTVEWRGRRYRLFADGKLAVS